MPLAFAAVVTSFTDVVMSLIGVIFGSDVSFDSITMLDGRVPIGMFITALVNFLIVAFVLFLIVKAYNEMQKPTEVAGPTEPELQTEIRDSLCDR